MLIVQKFGGSSVKDAERIRSVARIIAETFLLGHDVVVVLSAQGDTTDDLLAKAAELMTRYRMSFSDAYALYGKYIGDWGVRATEFRFDALKNGEVVKSVRLGAVKSLRLEARPSHTVLREGATYDVSAVRLAMTDQNGNVTPFWHGSVDVEIEGPLELIGPARPVLRGGLGGTYLRTVSEAGEAVVRLKTEQTEPVELRFIIKTE